MGKRLSQRFKPDAMISSPAMRAKATAQILATMINYPEERIVFDERIYEAEPEDLMSVIGDVGDDVLCAMLVGHNPALTILVKTLAQRAIPNMSPCSMVVLQSSTGSWRNFTSSNTELLDFDSPK